MEHSDGSNNNNNNNNNECSLSLSSTLRLQEDCRAVVHVKNLFVNYRQTNDGKVRFNRDLF